MPRRQKTRKTPQQPLSQYPVSAAILIICLVIQIACEIYPPLRYALCMRSGQPWGLLTYQFAHVSWMHFIGNFMFGLPFMASLEHRIGGRRLMIWYVLCGAISALLFQLIQGIDGGLIGASGSLSGVMMAACLMFGKAPLDRCIAVMLGATFLTLQILMATEDMVSGIAYWGHVGGMLCGILLVLGDSWTKPLPKQ